MHDVEMIEICMLLKGTYIYELRRNFCKLSVILRASLRTFNGKQIRQFYTQKDMKNY